MIKLFGITADFWKNKYSSDSYLTILKTAIVSEYKTGGTY
jgi:hypothetical protein